MAQNQYTVDSIFIFRSQMFHHNNWTLIECRYCMSPKLIKYWVPWYSGQRYKCQSCFKTFLIGGKRKQYTATEKKQVLFLAQDRSISKAAKVYRVSRGTIRKRRSLFALEDTTTQFVELNNEVVSSKNSNSPYIGLNHVREYRRVPV